MTEKKINLKEEKIWIAGHTGMVGQALKRRLSNHNIILASRNELNLTDTQSVREWFDIHRPSVVFLTAAKVGGIKANAEQPVDFLLDNLKIQNNVIEYSALNGVKKLIFMGSACSYPKNALQPIHEDSLFTGIPEVSNIWYATAKIAGIKLAQAFQSENRLNCVIAMPTNAYGLFDNFDEESGHVIPALMKKLHRATLNKDKNITIWGSGRPVREFIYVDDLADALVFLSENYNSNEIINIGGLDEISIFELTKIIADIVGFNGEILTDESRPDGMMRKLLDANKINKLGWECRTKLPDGLSKMYEWALLNNKL